MVFIYIKMWYYYVVSKQKKSKLRKKYCEIIGDYGKYVARKRFSECSTLYRLSK